jgi:Concanavalin A-like lectin/glucanases superfamily
MSMNNIAALTCNLKNVRPILQPVQFMPDVAWFKLNGNILDYRGDNIGKSGASTTSEQYYPYLSKSCFLFNGGPYATGNFISVPAISRPSKLTFSCFINVSTFKVFSRIFDFGSFRLHMKNATSLWFNDAYKITYKSSFQNTWKHIAFTVDEKTLTPYENGIAMAAITMTSSLSPTPSIGYIAHSMGADQNTGGMFSDFRIYGKVLRSSEIMAILQNNA